MKPLIVANWKMCPQNLMEAKRLFNSVKNGTKNIKNAEIVICPPFLYLLLLSVSLNRSPRIHQIHLGAQNCFYKESGAYTGEISPLMLKDLGCKYVIIGHSERRALGETDQMINNKIKMLLKTKLIPILCIGETQKQRVQGETLQVLRNQLKQGLKNIAGRKLQSSKFCIAYEPIWAIGSGNPCSADDAMSVGLFIKKTIASLYTKSVAKSLRILYGGSVNNKNSEVYIKQANMDGLLVGGASLRSKEFIEIVKKV